MRHIIAVTQQLIPVVLAVVLSSTERNWATGPSLFRTHHYSGISPFSWTVDDP